MGSKNASKNKSDKINKEIASAEAGVAADIGFGNNLHNISAQDFASAVQKDLAQGQRTNVPGLRQGFRGTALGQASNSMQNEVFSGALNPSEISELAGLATDPSLSVHDRMNINNFMGINPTAGMGIGESLTANFSGPQFGQDMANTQNLAQNSLGMGMLNALGNVVGYGNVVNPQFTTADLFGTSIEQDKINRMMSTPAIANLTTFDMTPDFISDYNFPTYQDPVEEAVNTIAANEIENSDLTNAIGTVSSSRPVSDYLGDGSVNIPAGYETNMLDAMAEDQYSGNINYDGFGGTAYNAPVETTNPVNSILDYIGNIGEDNLMGLPTINELIDTGKSYFGYEDGGRVHLNAGGNSDGMPNVIDGARPGRREKVLAKIEDNPFYVAQNQFEGDVLNTNPMYNPDNSRDYLFNDAGENIAQAASMANTIASSDPVVTSGNPMATNAQMHVVGPNGYANGGLTLGGLGDILLGKK